METFFYKVYAKPVTDKNGQVLYKKLKIYKIKGKQREEITKGKFLTLVANQFERIAEYLEENQGVILEIPVDFLIARTLIEALPLERGNLILTNPVSHISGKHLLRIKNFLEENTSAGLELSIYSKTFDRYRLQKVYFVCISPYGRNVVFQKNVSTMWTQRKFLKKLNPKGNSFAGNFLGITKNSLK